MCHRNSFITVLVVLSAIVVLAVCGVVIAGVVVGAGNNDLQRFCTTADGPNLDTASLGVAIGTLVLDFGSKKIVWDQQYMGLGSLPVGLAIHGPIPAGLKFAPVAVVLCGVPSSLVCDTSVADVLTGEIIETHTGGSIKPVIQGIMVNPRLYYLQFNTAGLPAGEIMAPLDSTCGVPV